MFIGFTKQPIRLGVGSSLSLYKALGMISTVNQMEQELGLQI